MVIVVPIQIINRHFVHTSACKREQTSKYTEEEDEEEKNSKLHQNKTGKHITYENKYK